LASDDSGNGLTGEIDRDVDVDETAAMDASLENSQARGPEVAEVVDPAESGTTSGEHMWLVLGCMPDSTCKERPRRCMSDMRFVVLGLGSRLSRGLLMF
jgi:hypothetical protein